MARRQTKQEQHIVSLQRTVNDLHTRLEQGFKWRERLLKAANMVIEENRRLIRQRENLLRSISHLGDVLTHVYCEDGSADAPVVKLEDIQ